MQITTNDRGQTVYRLEKIVDLAGLPEEELEKALSMLPVMIHGLRAAGFAAAIPEEQIPNMVESSIYWTVDDFESVSYRDRDGAELLGIRLVK